jgi:hypothetical protein
MAVQSYGLDLLTPLTWGGNFSTQVTGLSRWIGLLEVHRHPFTASSL